MFSKYETKIRQWNYCCNVRLRKANHFTQNDTFSRFTDTNQFNDGGLCFCGMFSTRGLFHCWLNSLLDYLINSERKKNVKTVDIPHFPVSISLVQFFSKLKTLVRSSVHTYSLSQSYNSKRLYNVRDTCTTYMSIVPVWKPHREFYENSDSNGNYSGRDKILFSEDLARYETRKTILKNRKFFIALGRFPWSLWAMIFKGIFSHRELSTVSNILFHH